MKFLLYIALLLTSPFAYSQMVTVNPTTVPKGTSYPDVRVFVTTSLFPFVNGEAKIRVSCAFAKAGTFDPIVFPGQESAGHHHTFIGNTGISGLSTPGSILNSGGSSCPGGAGIRFAGWEPSMVDSRNGRFIKPEQTLVYYYTVQAYPEDLTPISAGSPYVKGINRTPDNLRMIVGDHTNTDANPPSVINDKHNFFCVHKDIPGSYGQQAGIPNCLGANTNNPLDAYVRSYIEFPSCWNGVDLDSSDHKSHMAYPVGNVCPNTHPVRLATIAYMYYYPVKTTDDTRYWRLSSDNYDLLDEFGDPITGGYSLHADYIFGEPHKVLVKTPTSTVNDTTLDLFDMILTNCLRGKKDCGMGRLGTAPGSASNDSWHITRDPTGGVVVDNP